MDQYELYCLADRHFYDTLEHSTTDDAGFPILRRPAPGDWSSEVTGTWCYYAPGGQPPLPAQGWKIHVSARLDDAEKAIAAVYDYCVPRMIAFKFLRGPAVLVMVNSKAASRASSGKLITIYPRDEAQLELVLKELHELLRDVRGPYILSDLRYGEGPLFVRYGGFAERHCLSGGGERVLAVEDGAGQLVPDVRGATFSVPPWTTLPEFLQPHLAARNAVTLSDLPYEIDTVLHFSNGGGVYLARHLPTGDQVVLKEARPHAGLDALGRDAVTRLAHERDVLERLAGLGVAPELRDHFTVGEHHFLVQEFVDGTPLQRRLVHRYPLTRATCDADDLAAYTRWALGTLDQVEAAIEALHERGVVFGDLHPGQHPADRERTRGAHRLRGRHAGRGRAAGRPWPTRPSWHPPTGRAPTSTGTRWHACDWACSRRSARSCCPCGPRRSRSSASWSGRRSPALGTWRGRPRPPSWAATGPRRRSSPMPGSAPWPRAARRAPPGHHGRRDTRSRRPAVPRRRGPVPPRRRPEPRPRRGRRPVRAGGRPGPAASPSTRAGCASGHCARSRDRASDFTTGCTASPTSSTCSDTAQDALDLVDICLREKWDGLEPALHSGLAGIGLNLLHLGEPELTKAGLRAVDICADRLGGPDDVPEVSGGAEPAGRAHVRLQRTRPCCSCTPTSAPATRRCSTWPRSRSGRTCADAARPRTARSR